MISERTGLDSMTRAVLEGMDELGLAPNARFKKSANVVGALYATHGIPPRYGYDAICALSADWIVNIGLVDFHGNGGSPDPHDEPSAPRYTEVRLSRAGGMAVAAERGELPRLPIGLINGDLAFGGTAPPFAGDRVANALSAAAGDATDAELVELVGPPAFPSACIVEGDMAALVAGDAIKLRLSAHVAIETDDRGSQLVLTRFPYGSGAEEAGESLAARTDAARYRHEYAELREEMDIPLRDVRNESTGIVGYPNWQRLVCPLRPGADPEACRARVLETWPVTIELPVQLRAPLASLLRAFADDPIAQREAMASLLAS